MWKFIKSLFDPIPDPRDRLKIVGKLPDFEKERLDALHSKKVKLMRELGGFDTTFNDDDGNWVRHFEVMLELRRRIEALEKTKKN